MGDLAGREIEPDRVVVDVQSDQPRDPHFEDLMKRMWRSRLQMRTAYPPAVEDSTRWRVSYETWALLCRHLQSHELYDPDGHPRVLGLRVEVVPSTADIPYRTYEWAVSG